MQIGAIVMAAGLGKRMRSKTAKVLHAVAGRPMLLYTVELAQRIANAGVVVVVGHQAADVKAVLDAHLAASGGDRPTVQRGKGLTAHVGRGAKPLALLIAEQTEQLGTGHAVMQAMPSVPNDHTVLVLYGDVPLISRSTLTELLSRAGSSQ
ncbi:MAG TPA: NTP transferase domain-containing protein, partial [Nitrospirales bacterium]|nr:NTP transferase domain-containing protein [Nitrospirales bacterium]